MNAIVEDILYKIADGLELKDMKVSDSGKTIWAKIRNSESGKVINLRLQDLEID
jgi:hypothetical protein